VDEFGFGFPPKLFGKKIGETEYTFNALPFGGFVKIFGEDPTEESLSGPDAGRSLPNKPRWQQAAVLFAGVFSNFLLGWLLFSITFMSGLPMSVGSSARPESLQNVHLTVATVIKNSPAEAAGIPAGSTITHIRSDAESLKELNPENVKSFVESHPKSSIEITYTNNDNETKIVTVTPDSSSGTPFIGIGMDMVGIAKLGFLGAFREGMRLALDVTKSIVVGVYKLISEAIVGKGSLESVTGPVGLIHIVGTAYKFGFTYLLSFAALISLNLAVLNLLPFPALDGGRLFFLLVEKIKGSRINSKFANMANMIGFALLIILMLAVTYHDIVKLL